MNQTYVVPQLAFDYNNNVNLKKHQLKTKLNKLRQRTQLLLQNHSWKKYFNSPTIASSESDLTEVSNEEEECRNNQPMDVDAAQKSILVINSKSNSKLNSFFKENNVKVAAASTRGARIQLTQIENYFLTNSNTQLNLLNETPIMRDDERKSEMDFYETPCSNKKRNENESSLYYNMNSLPQTPKSAVRVVKKQQSLTFIGDLVSTSTPTRNTEEQITSTPNASTHNALKFHPSRTIRNKKLKRKLFTVSERKNEIKIQDIQSLFKEHKNLLKIKIDTQAACKQQHQLHRHQRHHHHHHHHHHNYQQQQQQHCPCYKYDQYYELKRLAHSSPKIVCKRDSQKDARIKLKSSSIEMRLKDLLYTPNKLKQLIRKQQEVELKKLQKYYQYKSELTTPTSTPAKAGALCTSSKIYFL